MANYVTPVKTIVNGENVDSAVTNRPLNDLIERTDFLKEQLDKIKSSFEVVTKLDVKVDDLVVESNVVYWNENKQKYDLAIAELEAAGAPPQFLPTDRNFVAGIVSNVRGTPGTKIADLHIEGVVKNINTTNLIESASSLEIGKPYWLTVNPLEVGKVTTTKPGLEVFLGVFVGPSTFLLNRDLKNLGESHIHYEFELDNSKWIDLGPETALTGSLTFTNGSTSVTGVGTSFTTEIAEGGAIKLDADDFMFE